MFVLVILNNLISSRFLIIPVVGYPLQNGGRAPASKSRFPQMVASSLGFGQKHDATVDIPLDSMNVRASVAFFYYVIFKDLIFFIFLFFESIQRFNFCAFLPYVAGAKEKTARAF